jgi:hypothetical protein
LARLSPRSSPTTPKNWTPWVTRRLLAVAVLSLPEGQRERYAEEWAAHLEQVPGVVGKLVVSLKFQIEAVGVREADAKARLEAWRDELAAADIEIHVLIWSEVMRSFLDSAEVEVEEGNIALVSSDSRLVSRQHEIKEGMIRLEQLMAPFGTKPALGITVAGITLTAEQIFHNVRAKVERLRGRGWLEALKAIARDNASNSRGRGDGRGQRKHRSATDA